MFTLWLIILIESSHYTSTIATDNSLIPQTENALTETTTIDYKPLPLQKRSFRGLDPVDESMSDSISETSLSQEETDKNNDQNDVTTPKIAPLVLQPNVANAIDAPDGGLLVPLVIPAVATATNTNLINTNDTINPLLISDLNLTTTSTDSNMLSG
ncbi:uncharacterized protein [Chelonus insularis]|nr:uncharacterized protein LOC118068993 isoform X2 [Chelonus insularis]